MNPSISCVTLREGASRFDAKEIEKFDVPNESFADGCSTGIAIFLEAIKASRDDGDAWFECIAEAAFTHVNDAGDQLHQGKRGAAVGFISTMGEALAAFSVGKSLEEFVGDLVNGERHCADELVKEARETSGRRVAKVTDAARMLSEVQEAAVGAATK